MTVAGFSEPEDIPAHLACVDVYVCPSVQETYGISVVQAMAMGLPVVHFGVGGLHVRARPHLPRSRCEVGKGGIERVSPCL